MKRILVLFLLVFLVSCANDSTKNVDEILIGNREKIIRINVEVADDNQERSSGLMLREALDKNSGMLFVFDDEDYRSFWMKNTLIPLDILFINDDLEIVDIKNAVPCKEDPCALYRSSAPVRYVLEVNANFTYKNGVNTGDKLQKTKLFK